jgi:uncharacterized protein (DUF2384 family)
VFAGSGLLHNRISIAVGINSLGYNEFFTKLFNKLGIEITDNVAHYLWVKENTRIKRLAKIQTANYKSVKYQLKRNNLEANTRLAKVEYLRKEGTYKTGMNVDGPCGELPVGSNNKDKQCR